MMTHRIQTTEEQLNTIQDGPQPVKMMLEDEGFQVGEYIYFLLQDGEALAGLVCRKVTSVVAQGKRLEPGCVIVEVQ